MPGPKLWAKLAATTVIVGLGGPALVYKLVPTEAELVAKYNPDLRARSAAGRARTEREFDEFVTGLKEYSKSSKPIWVAMEEADRKKMGRGVGVAAVGNGTGDRPGAKDLSDREKRRLEMKAELERGR